MKQWIITAFLALIAGSFGAILVYRYAPLNILEQNVPKTFGNTSITTIQGSDTLSASRTTINNNFSSLNANKVEISDLAGTTSLQQLTTLTGLTTTGTITSGTWHGSTLTVPFGGTGSTTLSQYQVLLGNGTGNVTTPVGWGSSGQLLTSNGPGVLPSWGSASFDTTQNYNFTGTNLFKNFVASSTLYVSDGGVDYHPILFSYFGDGRDGSLTIANNSTTTLTHDVYYTDLTINGALVTNGCRVYVSGTISGSGSVNFGLANTGSVGSNGSGDTGGVGGNGGATTTTNCSWPNRAGTKGGTGGSGINQNGGGASNDAPIISSLTGAGSVGGIGGTQAGQSGGAAGTLGDYATSSIFTVYSNNIFTGTDSATTTGTSWPSAIRYFYSASTGATGGGGGGTNNSSCSSTCGGGGGGGGGASGGIVWIFARTWAGTFNILSQGAAGGNGGNASGSGSGGGGGGAGGNGGVSVVVYAQKTWTGSYSLSGGSPGAAGSTGSPSAGSAGHIGISYEIPFTSLMR